jgi:hypothetical protein
VFETDIETIHRSLLRVECWGRPLDPSNLHSEAIYCLSPERVNPRMNCGHPPFTPLRTWNSCGWLAA